MFTRVELTIDMKFIMYISHATPTYASGQRSALTEGPLILITSYRLGYPYKGTRADLRRLSTPMNSLAMLCAWSVFIIIMSSDLTRLTKPLIWRL